MPYANTTYMVLRDRRATHVRRVRVITGIAVFVDVPSALVPRSAHHGLLPLVSKDHR